MFYLYCDSKFLLDYYEEEYGMSGIRDKKTAKKHMIPDFIFLYTDHDNKY